MAADQRIKRQTQLARYEELCQSNQLVDRLKPLKDSLADRLKSSEGILETPFSKHVDAYAKLWCR
jgi:hypothetical protein